MCGRYVLTSPIEALRRLFRLSDGAINLPARYNVAPTQAAPVVRMGDGGRALVLIRWGLVPSWSKEIGTKPLINARGETVAEKPSFRRAFERRRCLVPATGFYEWPEHGPLQGQPLFFHLRPESSALPADWRPEDGLPAFAFAGLWERWHDPQGGATVDSFAILSTAANGFMQQFHARIPVALAPQDHAAWLEAPAEEAKALIRAAPDDWFACHPVDKRVNSPRHDDPQLIEPLVEGFEAKPAAAPAPKPARGRAKKDDRQASLF